MKNIFLASDNTSPAHPNIIEYILKANQHHASSYGNDEWTQSASKLLAEVFKKTCKVLFVPTGTGANILSLKLMLKSHTSVICSDIAHIAVNETGAPEAVVGCKLLLIKSHHGKISAEDVLKVLKKERFSGKHATYPKVVSITQPTEVGTLYTLNELQALRELCSKESLFLIVRSSKVSFPSRTDPVDLDHLIYGRSP